MCIIHDVVSDTMLYLACLNILVWKLGVVMCQQCSQSCSRNIWTQNMGSKLLENRAIINVMFCFIRQPAHW